MGKISVRTATATDLPSDVLNTIQGVSDRRTVLSLASVVTPEKYGAVGNGTTNDTAACQAALDTGAPAVFFKNCYKVTTTLQLRQDQIIFGLPKSLIAPTFSAGTTPGIDYQGAANTVAIKNASGTNGNGVQDMLFHVNDNGSTVIQFATSYGNVARRIHYTGTFRIGLLAEDTYVGDFDTHVFNGASVRTACMFFGIGNTHSIKHIHTGSTYPNDSAECLYGIAMTNGYDHSIEHFVAQGPTIGLAVTTVRELRVNGFYSENCLCPMRLGNIGAGTGSAVITGGMYSAPINTHSQYAKRGPLIIHNLDRLTMTAPGFENTADNTTARGPWPIVLDAGNALTLINPFHFGASATTYARDLLYRKAAGSDCGLVLLGSQVTSNPGMELILKDTDNFNSSCHGISVNNAGTIASSAYQPAVIFAAIDALLTTDLPTGASLVI